MSGLLSDQFGPSSGKPFEVAIQQLGWTDSDLEMFRQEGYKILDIGAGFSGLVPGLLEAGIDAIAVDPKYGQPNKVFTDEIKSARESLLSDIGYLFDPAHRNATETILDLYSNAFKEFKFARKKHPERFIEASFGSLPFDEDFFNRVVSMDAVSAYANEDEQQFYQGILDAARVTKSGGIIAMTPWYINPGLVRSIKSRGIILPTDRDAYDAKLQALSEKLPEAGQLLRRRLVSRRLFNEGIISSIERSPSNGSDLNTNVSLLTVA